MERDIKSEFNTIVEQYKISPFGFRLRKTGSIIKLVEYNGLYYIDLINLFKVVNELLGPNVSEEIMEYISKIIFSETISVDAPRGSEIKTMTCTQFIDNSFFNKCANWINQKIEQNNNDYSSLFGSFLGTNSRYSTHNDECTTERYPFIDDLVPFRNYIPDHSSGHGNSNEIHRNILNISRPRGKQMDMSGENLEERPFICEVEFCDRAFKRHEHLKRHMKMHTGDKPFKCSFPNCNKTFSRSDNLQQHKKTHGSYFKSEKQIRFKNDTSNISKYGI